MSDDLIEKLLALLVVASVAYVIFGIKGIM